MVAIPRSCQAKAEPFRESDQVGEGDVRRSSQEPLQEASSVHLCLLVSAEV
jgi:hypothetical protein